jgi:hypothetical protein
MRPDGDPLPSEITCTISPGHSWPVTSWTRLARAHTYRWRRYTHAGRAYYHPNDVTAIFDDLTQDEH